MKTSLIRRISGVGIAVASLGLGLFAVPGTSAQDTVPGVVDVQATIAPVQPQVTVGELAAYDVVVTQGTVPVPGTVTVTLPPGSDVMNDLSTGCTRAGDGATATCPFEASSVPVELQVVASTPSPGVYTVTAAVTAVTSVVVGEEEIDLEYTPNNTSSASIEILALNDGVAAGVVLAGGKIELHLADGRSYILEVPENIGEGKKGVIVKIEGFDPGACAVPLGTCGGDGFLTTFDERYEQFTAYEPTMPLVTTKTFGIVPPCRGLGNDCIRIGFSIDKDVPLYYENKCDVAGSVDADTGPCENGRFRTTSGHTWFQVLMLSKDPIEIPIGRL